MSHEDKYNSGLIPWKRRTQASHPDDQDLVRRCREGDVEAADILFRRYHHTAVKMAARESRSFDPEELASEALIRVWIAMRGGGGPEHAFPPYLKATIRNLAATWSAQNREQPVEDEQLDAALSRANSDPGFETALSEHQVMMAAFDSLPERWRSVLWMTEVEGLKAADVAERLGLTPNTAAALSKRARAALSRAWLQAHVERHADASDDCEWTLDRMAGYVREALTPAQQHRASEHIDGCSQCAGAMRGVAHLGASLRIAVLVVGGSAATILAWSAASAPPIAAAAVTVGAGVGGRSPAKSLRRTVDRSGKAVAVAAVAVLTVAGVAFAATSLSGFNFGRDNSAIADGRPVDTGSDSGSDPDGGSATDAADTATDPASAATAAPSQDPVADQAVGGEDGAIQDSSFSTQAQAISASRASSRPVAEVPAAATASAAPATRAARPRPSTSPRSTDPSVGPSWPRGTASPTASATFPVATGTGPTSATPTITASPTITATIPTSTATVDPSETPLPSHTGSPSPTMPSPPPSMTVRPECSLIPPGSCTINNMGVSICCPID